MFANVLLKGDQGLPGEIGAPGERGAGEPGAKVSLLNFSNKSTINMKTFVFFMHIKVCSCLLQRIYIYLCFTPNDTDFELLSVYMCRGNLVIQGYQDYQVYLGKMELQDRRYQSHLNH